MTPKPGPRRGACPSPKKLTFTTKDLADQALLKVLGNMVVHDHQGKMPTRVYHCTCNYYHLTSKGKPIIC